MRFFSQNEFQSWSETVEWLKKKDESYSIIFDIQKIPQKVFKKVMHRTLDFLFFFKEHDKDITFNHTFSEEFDLQRSGKFFSLYWWHVSSLLTNNKNYNNYISKLIFYSKLSGKNFLALHKLPLLLVMLYLRFLTYYVSNFFSLSQNIAMLLSLSYSASLMNV